MTGAKYKKVNSVDEWKSLGLEYSTPINLHLWSDSPEHENVIKEAISWSYLDRKGSGHLSTTKRLLNVILQNLFRAYFKDPQLFCAYSRDKSDYSSDMGWLKTFKVYS